MKKFARGTPMQPRKALTNYCKNACQIVVKLIYCCQTWTVSILMSKNLWKFSTMLPRKAANLRPTCDDMSCDQLFCCREGLCETICCPEGGESICWPPKSKVKSRLNYLSFRRGEKQNCERKSAKDHKWHTGSHDCNIWWILSDVSTETERANDELLSRVWAHARALS